MDRRTTIKWVLAAGATWSALGKSAPPAAAAPASEGYGTDPNLQAIYRPGQLWPLTFTAAQRHLAATLSDIIIPADEHSPSASSVGVTEFIDEWVSAPYPANRLDRPIVLNGLLWLDAEAARRFKRGFVDLGATDQHAICDDICEESRAAAKWRTAARFFARYRDLTAGAFYSSPVGRKDLGYIGNVPLAHFEGPPRELLRKLNLP
jgi:Gluconate 2-dehydrogenase subunit 3